MPDTFHDFPIAAPPADVFRAVSTGEGLAQWWTERSSGTPREGAEYELWFGPTYDWRARVTHVRFRLAAANGGTQVRFHHVGWPERNERYRISCYCRAMNLRILKRHLEHGESVPYAQRLDV